MKDLITKTLLISSLLALCIVSSAQANEEDKPTASADLGVFSKYVWRGYELSDDSVVVQPSITIAYKDFSMNLWGNLDTNFENSAPVDDQAEWNETDLTLSYDTNIGPISLGVGYIYYALDGIDDSQELYISAGLDVFTSPTLTVYREIAYLPGWYLNFSVSHAFGLPHEIVLDLEGSAGYHHSDDDGFVEVDDALNPATKKYQNFHNGSLSVSLTVPFSQYFTFSPLIAYSFPLSDKADDLITATSLSNDADFFYGGFALSVSF